MTSADVEFDIRREFAAIALTDAEPPPDRPGGGGTGLASLSEELFQFHIVPFCASLASLSALAATSRQLRRRCYARLTCPAPTLDLCIDLYCPLCPMRKQHGTSRGTVSLIASFPLRRLKMHCFVSDVPACLSALAAKRTVESLELRLTNKSLSCSLDRILPRGLGPDDFPALRELVLDSSHLQHVNVAGRVRLLSMLGAHLEVLVLSGTSSAGLLHHLSALCPRLRRLRVDRVRSEGEIAGYKSESLAELDVRRVSFVLPPLRLPMLRRLRYSSSSRLEPVQMEAMVASLPRVRDLVLEVCSRDADLTVAAICRHLPGLRSLTLEGSYEAGALSAQALQLLGRSCPITDLCVRSAQSVTPLALGEGAFLQLAKLPELASAVVPYSDDIFTDLFAVLSSSPRLRRLIFWERRKWLGTPKWLEIEHTLAVYAASFPAIELRLRDVQQLGS